MKGSAWINLLVGLWLIVATFVLPVSVLAHTAWTGNDIILGVLLVAFSAWMLNALAAPLGAGWLQMLCGVWLIAAPFVVGYSAIRAAMLNDVVCGVIAIVFGAVASWAISRSPLAA